MHRGRPAARRPDLVPLQRPDGRQGDLHGHRAHRPRLPGRLERHAHRRAPGRAPGRVGARAAGADVDLPRHAADRALRSSSTRRAPAVPSALAAPRPGCRLPAPRSPTSPAMLEIFSGLFGPLPLRRLHRGRHRRPARDPAGVADPVDLRHQPPQPAGRRSGSSPTSSPTSGSATPSPPPRCGTSGCTRASPATPSGCGRSRSGARPPRRRPSGTTPCWPACRRTSCSPTPGRTTPSTTGSTSAAPSPCTRCAAPWATTCSSPCCAPGSTATASASSPPPTSRRWCATRRRRPRPAARPVAARARPAARWSAPRRHRPLDERWAAAPPTVFTASRSADDAEHDDHPRAEHPAPAHPVHDLPARRVVGRGHAGEAAGRRQVDPHARRASTTR